MKITIEAGRTESHYWKDLWQYRELFYFLAWRDLLVRYKQTVIGVAWAILRPLLTMLALTLVFGKIANLPSDGVPYPILVLAALLPWQFFANAFATAGNSLINNANLVSKVYFSRITIPASSIVVSFVDFLISLAVLALLMLWYGFVPSIRILLLPLFTLLAILASLGSALWISSLNVRYRDFRYIIPFVVQFGLYVSPVGFSSNVVPDNWRFIYSLNPMVGVIDGFRWALLGEESQLYAPGLAISIVIVVVVLITGYGYFRKTEKTFADVI